MNELEIKDLTIHYITRSGTVQAVNGVSFSIGQRRNPRPGGRDRRRQDHHRAGHPPAGAQSRPARSSAARSSLRARTS